MTKKTKQNQQSKIVKLHRKTIISLHCNDKNQLIQTQPKKYQLNTGRILEYLTNSNKPKGILLAFNGFNHVTLHNQTTDLSVYI